MNSATGGERLPEAFGKALVELGERDPRLAVFEAGGAGAARTAKFGEVFPERFFDVGAMSATMVEMATGAALGGRTVFASAPAPFAAGAAYTALRESVCYRRANVKIVAVLDDGPVQADRAAPPMIEDIGLMRALPRMTVVVPADAPTARAATFALAERPGPAYLRLSGAPLPTVTDGSFAVGRATELRAGGDLTIVAVGALVARALALADELARVGISARVLDFASVKPFDEPALLRAARDTGAILVLEAHTVLTGVGALVASTTAENYPVPVRRAGVPDVWPGPGSTAVPLDRYGMSTDGLRDEAWELLKSRGKVT
ncbi:MAG: transketolase family protein [Thermoplasmata archaeon]